MEDIVIFKCCNLNNTTCLLYCWVKHFISNSISVKIFYFCCSFYNLDGTDFDSINKFLSSLVEKALYELECSYCIEVDDVSIYPYIIYTCIYAPGSVWTGVFLLYWGGWCEYIPLYYIYIYAPGSVWTGVFLLYWGGWCEYIPLYPLLALKYMHVYVLSKWCCIRVLFQRIKFLWCPVHWHFSFTHSLKDLLSWFNYLEKMFYSVIRITSFCLI